MKLDLSSVGNPDFGQNPNEPLWGCPIRNAVVEVQSFEHASTLCQQFIDIGELGGGNWSGGLITDDDGFKIAYVSYNGRVWEITKDAPMHSGKCKEIILDSEKKIARSTFTLFKNDDSTFAYKDGRGRAIVFKGKDYSKMLNQFQTFSLLSSTHKDFQNTYMLDLFIDRWSWAGFKEKADVPKKVEFYI